MNSIGFAIFLASILVASQAEITRPDKVLVELDNFKKEVSGYQTSIQQKISSFRESNGELTGDHYNISLAIIEENIKSISVSDVVVRETLAEQKQTACIINLVGVINNLIELSGYAISNCISLKDNSNYTINSDFKELLDSFERDVTVLSEVIINALIGRNIFTQGNEILERVQDQLKAKYAEFDAVIAALAERSTGVTVSMETEVSSLKTCFVEVDESIQSGIAAIKGQIPICVRFSGRGARSAVIIPFEANDFFPQLN